MVKAKSAAGDRANKGGCQHLWRIVSTALIGAGVLLILFVAGVKLYTVYQQNALIRQYENGSASVSQGTAEDVTELPNPDDLLQVGDGSIEVVGVLEIPAIDLRVAIGEGVDKKTLKYTAGHFEGAAMPGAKGNCSLIGHRSYTWGEFFNRLNELKVGDEIIARYGGKTYTYTVIDSFVVDPDDVWVLDDSEDSEITLITCTPIRVATQRLIVKGVLEE